MSVPSRSEPAGPPQVSLVVPLYNEASGARSVIRALLDALDAVRLDYELVLVENGSTDGTGDVIADLARAHPRVVHVRVPTNRGYGLGVRRGLEAARGAWMGFVGGDGQVAPADAVRVVRTALGSSADLVKARRVARGDGWARRIQSSVFNALFRALFHVRSRDVNGTPKVLRRRAYEAIRPSADDWFLDAEIVLACHRLGLDVVEVDLPFLRREAGRSHVRLAAVREFLANMARARRGRRRAHA